VTITGQEEPYLDKESTYREINPEFLNKMIQNEKDLDYLLSNYYEETIPLRYTYHNKICGIRELEQ